MLFKDFSGFESRKTENTDSQITTPIQKCSGRTYYCYYLKEQNKGKFQFTTQIARFEIAVLQSELSHQAPVKLVISSEKNIMKLMDYCVWMRATLIFHATMKAQISF